MPPITPCLWFDGQAQEAAEFYVSIFPDSRIDHRNTCATDWPAGKAGDVILVEFTLFGQRYQALNGGPGIEFNEAVSLSVSCKDQAEVDRIWSALLEGGGEEVQCGWLKDRFGVRWQIVPEEFETMLRSPDPVRTGAAMTAMMGMVKLDMAKLGEAFEGAKP